MVASRQFLDSMSLVQLKDAATLYYEDKLMNVDGSEKSMQRLENYLLHVRVRRINEKI